MGKTLVILKVYPEGPEVQDALEIRLKNIKTGELQELRKEPLAFGLNIFRIAVTLPEKESGAMDKLEEELKAVKGVSEIEIEGTTLL